MLGMLGFSRALVYILAFPFPSVVDVVREAMESAGVAAGDTNDVRLALHALLPHGPERWPLTM